MPAAPRATHHSARIRVWSFTVLVITMTALLFSAPLPALAHDELTASTPASGEALTALPEEVQLTFTNPPSGIGAAVIVTDNTGTSWAEGPVSITNNIATQPLRAGAPAGEYTVQWRVVSADSHPIEGTFRFNTTEETPGGNASPAAPDTNDGIAVTTSSDDSGNSVPAVVLVIVLAGICLTGALMVFIRHNLKNVEKK